MKIAEDKPPTLAKNISSKNNPTGKQFAAWLDAMNSGRREILQQFIEANFEPPPNAALPVERITNRHFAIYQTTGGLIVRKVADATEPGKISVVLESKQTGFYMTIGMATQKTLPNKLYRTR